MPVGAYEPVSFVPNGVTTVFPYNFRVISSTDLVVAIDGVTVSTSDYTVSGVGNPSGGNVTFSLAPTGTAGLIEREVPYTRTEDYQANGDLKEETLDKDFDRRVMQIQQLDDRLKRTLHLPAGVDYPGELTAEDFGSSVLAFDADGQPIPAAGVPEAPVSTFMATVLDDATSNAALTTLTETRTETHAVGVPVLLKLKDAASLRNFGMACDGSDETTKWQYALSEFDGKVLYVPQGGVVGIEDQGLLELRDGFSLRSDGGHFGAYVRWQGSADSAKSMLKMRRCSSCVIQGLQFFVLGGAGAPGKGIWNTSDGQSGSASITAQNTFTSSIMLTGAARSFSLSLSALTGTGSTATLQVSTDGSAWSDAASYTTNQSITYTDLNSGTRYYRLGVKTGNYSSGTIAAALTYAGLAQFNTFDHVRVDGHSVSGIHIGNQNNDTNVDGTTLFKCLVGDGGAQAVLIEGANTNQTGIILGAYGAGSIASVKLDYYPRGTHINGPLFVDTTPDSVSGLIWVSKRFSDKLDIRNITVELHRHAFLYGEPSDLSNIASGNVSVDAFTNTCNFVENAVATDKIFDFNQHGLLSIKNGRIAGRSDGTSTYVKYETPSLASAGHGLCTFELENVIMYPSTGATGTRPSYNSIANTNSPTTIRGSWRPAVSESAAAGAIQYLAQGSVTRFLARNTTNPTNITGNGATYTVVFDTEVHDDGGNFASNTFTAPVTGQYDFHAAVTLGGLDAAMTSVELQIVTSNRPYPKRFSFAPIAGGVNTYEITETAVDMERGDQAYVTIQGSNAAGDTADLIGSVGGTPFTVFSGSLRAP